MAKHAPLRTYADAYVLSLPKKADGVGELLVFHQVLTSYPVIRSYLSDASILKEDRMQAIKQINPEAIDQTISFILVLGEDGLIEMLDRIIDQIRKSYQRLTSYEYVKVTSAVELTKDEQKRIEKALTKEEDHEIRLELNIDSSIIGGLIIQQNDWLLNASVQGRLEHLKRTLTL
jgi:F-type H+-transporting ATPase subunit delta